MMREEFEKMIGLEITQEEYEPIEVYYASMPSSVDKQKFVKSWLREGGIQKLFDRRAEDIAILKARIKSLGEDLAWQEKDRCEQIKLANERYDRIQELEEKLAAINTITAA